MPTESAVIGSRPIAIEDAVPDDRRQNEDDVVHGRRAGRHEETPQSVLDSHACRGNGNEHEEGQVHARQPDRQIQLPGNRHELRLDHKLGERAREDPAEHDERCRSRPGAR